MFNTHTYMISTVVDTTHNKLKTKGTLFGLFSDYRCDFDMTHNDASEQITATYNITDTGITTNHRSFATYDFSAVISRNTGSHP
jgi:hypothetical protein